MMESKLKVTVGTPGPETVDRVVELVNRTNQINFSTNRYTRDQVEALLASDRHLCFVAAAEDRYGPYGTIGFACLRLEANGTGTVQDLMLSCRIQGRGVEAAIISTVADVAYRKGLARLVGLFRPTSRNGHISSVYANLGFQRNGMEGDFQRFALGLSGKRPSVPAHIQLIISDDVASLHAEGIPFVRKIVEDLVHRGALEGTILDVGAGWDGILGEDCDTWLVNSGRKHVRLDMEEYPRTDIVANAQNMPEVGDAEVASVMCLDVLEHCTNPFALSSELMRVLKPGGTAVVSAPMNYVIHNHPGDYWRFTPDGLKLLFLGNSEIVSEHVEGEEDHPVRTVLVVRKSAPACQRV